MPKLTFEKFLIEAVSTPESQQTQLVAYLWVKDAYGIYKIRLPATTPWKVFDCVEPDLAKILEEQAQFLRDGFREVKDFAAAQSAKAYDDQAAGGINDQTL